MTETTRLPIKRARVMLDLNMKQAADLAGISHSYWLYIENGERNPSMAVIKRVAAVLREPPSKLFTELGEMS